ncbi:MAG: hypothetical protein RLZZ511_1276 [Cyanobacteriota bacterium]|jgi:hypothetical protein
MLSQDLKAQVINLPPSDRLALIATLVESRQESRVSQSDRAAAIQQMRGLLKTDRSALTDDEVAIMLEERRSEK